MIHILGFDQELRLDGTTADWVTYAAPGEANMAATRATVRSLMPNSVKYPPEHPKHHRKSDEVVELRWTVIGPAYEAWKRGNEIPEHGTPLGAWPGLSKAQVDAFRGAGFRTVEDVAQMNDSQMGRVRLPQVRALRDQAAKFLANMGAADLTARLDQKDAQIAELMEQMKALQSKGKRKTEEATA